MIKKDTAIHFRVTKVQKDLINANAKNRGVSVASFLVELGVIGKSLGEEDKANIKNIFEDIREIQTSVTQISRKLVFSKEKIVLEELKEVVLSLRYQEKQLYRAIGFLLK